MKFSKMTAKQLRTLVEAKLYDIIFNDDIAFQYQDLASATTIECIIDCQKVYFYGYADYEGDLMGAISFVSSSEKIITDQEDFCIYPDNPKYESVLIQLIKNPVISVA